MIDGINNDKTMFKTGAVRDIQEDKGRCDLLPCPIIARLLGTDEARDVLMSIHCYIFSGDVNNLINAINAATLMSYNWNRDDNTNCVGTMILELSKHYKHGLEKYGERNWEQGIPEHSYIDSAIRHYIKWKSGWTDEDHAIAFVWNLVSCAYTSMYIELDNPYIHDLPYSNNLSKNTKEEDY